jgi:hypothetical protein
MTRSGRWILLRLACAHHTEPASNKRQQRILTFVGADDKISVVRMAAAVFSVVSAFQGYYSAYDGIVIPACFCRFLQSRTLTFSQNHTPTKGNGN